MSTNDELDDDLTEDGGDNSNLVRDLRKQLKAAKAKDAERDALLNEFLAQKRQATVAKALEAKGANTGFAKFYTSEDSSEEAVNAWVTENADLIGVGSDDRGADQETINAAARISQGLSSAPPVKPGNAEALLTEFATTTDPVRHRELKAALAQMTPTQ